MFAFEAHIKQKYIFNAFLVNTWQTHNVHVYKDTIYVYIFIQYTNQIHYMGSLEDKNEKYWYKLYSTIICIMNGVL